MKNSTHEQERERTLQLLSIVAHEFFGAKAALIEINATLGDIRTLTQQEVDLLRRLVERSALP